MLLKKLDLPAPVTYIVFCGGISAKKRFSLGRLFAGNKDYPESFKQEMVDVQKELRILSIRIKRLDWVLSGDDSVDDWSKRLKEDLYELRLTEM